MEPCNSVHHAWLPKPINRKRRIRDGPQREGQEGSFGVVACDAVGAELAAGAAAVDDGPFAVATACADLDADGFHHALAGAGAVAGGFVDVPAVEAGRAVVAMLGAPRLAGDLEPAVDARKAIRLVSAELIRL